MVNVGNKLNMGMTELPHMPCLMPLPDCGGDLREGAVEQQHLGMAVSYSRLSLKRSQTASSEQDGKPAHTVSKYVAIIPHNRHSFS